MSKQEYEDPFASYDKTPAVSFKGKHTGYETRLVVQRLPRLVQTRDFKTKKPAFWPENEQGERNPKMAAVIEVEEDGQTRALWATKPSSLFAAIKAAQEETGQIQVGSVLVVRIDDEVETDGGNDRKEYAVEHILPNAFEDDTPPWER